MSSPSYNMLLWRMCRLFMRMRESALSDGSSVAAAAVGGGPAPSVSTKQELRGLALRIARVVSTMNRYGYRVTPQSGAMLQVLTSLVCTTHDACHTYVRTFVYACLPTTHPSHVA